MEEIMNRTKTTSRIQHILFAAFFFLIAVFLLISLIISPSHDSFNNEEISKLSSEWYSNSGEFLADSLPAHFPYDENGTATVCTVLPEDLGTLMNSMCFRASQNSVRIWIDGELFLEQEHIQKAVPIFGKSPGSSWIMLRLPDDCAGKELRIELTSPYQNYRGYLPEIYLGTKSAILYYIIRSHLPGLITSMILMVLSAILLIFYIVFTWSGFRNRQIFMIGLFGIFAGIWMFGESHILQFFTGKLITWFDLTMISLHLLPLPILFIVADLPDFPYRRCCMWTANFLAAYLTVLLVLQALGIVDLMELLNLSMGILPVCCVAIPGLIFWDFLHNKNRKIYPMTAAVSILGLFSCIELVYDLIDLKTYVGGFVQIGILFFYIIVSVATIRQAVGLFEKGLQTAYYRQLSYIDQMTDCQNRRAFTERENTWTPGNQDAIVMIDLNHLKQVNDTLGHDAGDDYIIACAKALKQVFGEKGTCYRLGGDEFLFWGNYLSEQELSGMAQQFTELVQESCLSISPLCSVAVGIAVLSPDDQSIADTMRRADHNMYCVKKVLKQEIG